MPAEPGKTSSRRGASSAPSGPVRDLTRPENTGGLLRFDQMAEAGGGRQGRARSKAEGGRAAESQPAWPPDLVYYYPIYRAPRAPGAQRIAAERKDMLLEPEGRRGEGELPRNVFGGRLEDCSVNPLTGFLRDGCCNTGPEDIGSHTVCVVITDGFLRFSKSRGNDLSTPMPEFGFPGLKAGDRWCLCAPRWQEAFEAGQALRAWCFARPTKPRCSIASSRI